MTEYEVTANLHDVQAMQPIPPAAARELLRMGYVQPWGRGYKLTRTGEEYLSFRY